MVDAFHRVPGCEDLYAFGGLPAWLTWLFVHLITLIGFRNKLLAIFNWGWNYITYDRGIRLIIPPFRNKGIQEEGCHTATRTGTR